ncbi:hypothetical protein ACHAXA_007335 [Cyclostephanos tholiformis]|uniref:RRM domain-containing protein n=1 Tax=Cyclostephanos tholiformis TaxID=382380 RepID=A0ABD3R5A2_9STRA
MWNASTAGASGYYGHQPPGIIAQQQQQQQPPPQQQQQQQQQPSSSAAGAPRHDVFVGNLAFATTEEQLHAAFSEVGRVIRVRMVSDIETGKPRGFAFVEFEDPQAALSAIRNMNDYEINGRKLRVNFSNSSHLETLASQLGMDLSNVGGPSGGVGGGVGNKNAINNNDDNNPMGPPSGGMMTGGMGHHQSGGGGTGGMTMMDGASTMAGGGAAGSRAVAQALRGMNKGEMYDVVARLKEIADANPDEARRLLTQHPQLPEAILYCMSELDMIKTPVLGTAPPGMGIATTILPTMTTSVPPPAAIVKPVDPRAAARPPPPTAVGGLPPGGGTSTMTVPTDPRAAARVNPADPRSAAAAAAAAARDPRAMPTGVGAPGPPPNFPAPPPMMGPPSGVIMPPAMTMPPPMVAGMHQQMQQPPPSQQQQQHPQHPAMGGIDATLAQQVMALTPTQIAQLPPDKQQNILLLRQQITGGMLR